MTENRRSVFGRGRWLPLQVPEDTPNLLEDLPDSAPALVDIFEQQRVKEELTNVILGFLDSTADYKTARTGERNLILALHGRYGQGKTRIVDEIRAQIDDTMLCGKRWCRPLAVRDFRCSDYVPDDLQFKFDQLLESGRGLRLLIPAFAIGSLAFWALWALGLLGTSFFDHVSAIVAVVAGAFVLPYRHVLRHALRQYNMNMPLRSIGKTLADSLFGSTDVLILDDLDRAAPAQQTALLASLQRFKSEFSGVVLVVFDDAPLLEALDTRERAGEYITKVFHASFRLAPMNARDAGTMAAEYGFTLRDSNPDCQIARKFGEPLVCGALARVFHLHGTASARFAKKLVNNVYCAARVGRFTNETDIIALVRLHALLQSLPILEARLEVLAQSLLEASDNELFDHVAARFDSALSSSQKSKVSDFLARTAHMQPARLSWLRQLRIWRSSPSVSDIAPPEAWQDDWTRSWAMAEALLVGLRAPQDRREEYQKLRKHVCRPPAHPELQASVLTPREKSPPKNASDHSQRHSTTRLPDNESKVYWNALVAQVYLFDREVVALDPDETVSNVLSDHRSQPLNTLYFSEPGNFRLGSIRTIFRHSLLSSDRLYDVRLGIELRTLLSPTKQTRVIDVPLALCSLSDQIDASSLDSVWPPFTDANPDQVLRNFRLLGTLLRDVDRSKRVLPLAHRDWIQHTARDGNITAVTDAVRETLNFGDTNLDDAYWHEGFVRRLWDIEGVSSWDSEEHSFVHALISLGSGPQQPFWPLWLLSLHSETQRVAKELVLRWTSVVLPKPTVALAAVPDWYEPIEELSGHWPLLQDALQKWVLRSTSEDFLS